VAGRATPPPDIAPEEFFLEWVPRVVRADQERQRRLANTRAILEFALDGADGGVFTLELAEGGVLGRAGHPARCDLRVELDVATWRALNAGDLSAPEAFLKRRVRLHGDLTLAVKLHVILG
jgi:putative sterol carrier protein